MQNRLFFLIAGATALAVFIIFSTAPQTFGAFTATSPASVILTGKTVSSSSQTTSATISNVTVNDDRGGSPGWTLVVTANHLTFIGSAMKIFGANDTVTSAGTYDGTLLESSPLQKYTLTIDSGGSVGTATFDVSGAETQQDLVTGSFVSIGTKGVRANFDIATYSTGDQWQILVDIFAYTNLTVTPSDITVNSGSGTGVVKGSQGTLTGSGATSQSKLLMEAATGYGTGNYSQDVGLSWNLHANSLLGTFTSDLIFTLS